MAQTRRIEDSDGTAVGAASLKMPPQANLWVTNRTREVTAASAPQTQGPVPQFGECLVHFARDGGVFKASGLTLMGTTYAAGFPNSPGCPARYIHRPWEALHPVLEAAGVKLGRTYPKPRVNHTAARDRFLRVAEGHLGSRS